MNECVRIVALFFVLFRVITHQNYVERSFNATVRFFKSEYYTTYETSPLKQVGLSETIYFEIIDNFGEEESVSNWPVNCWVTLNINESIDDSKTFLKDGCPSENGDVSLYYETLYKLRIRVGFKLLKIYEVFRKNIDVQCQYVKCSTSPHHVAWPLCPDIARCTKPDRLLMWYQKDILQSAISETHLMAIYKPPKEIKIPSPPFKHNKDLIVVEEKSSCDCSNNALSSQKYSSSKNDDRLQLPVVAAVAFASFAIGLLLMAGLCWIGTGRKGDVKDDQLMPQSHLVKYEPSSASNESILNWSSRRSSATYTSVIPDSDQRSNMSF